MTESVRFDVSQKPTVILILGLGHSGSTILERALSSYSGSIGLGEVSRTFKDYKEKGIESFDRPCTCGEDFANCSIWSNLTKKSSENIDELQLYELISHTMDVSGCMVIVDSSKHTTQFDLYSKLQKKNLIDLYSILLIRDYRAWCLTRKFQKIKNETGAASFIKRSWKWFFGYIKMITHLKKENNNFLIISYDLFATKPDSILARIRKFAKLSTEQTIIDNVIQAVNQHAMRGNGMRFNMSKNRLISYSCSWKKDWRPKVLKLFVFGPEIFRLYMKTKY